MTDFPALFAALSKAGVELILVGGVAATASDLDFEAVAELEIILEERKKR